MFFLNRNIVFVIVALCMISSSSSFTHDFSELKRSLKLFFPIACFMAQGTVIHCVHHYPIISGLVALVAAKYIIFDTFLHYMLIYGGEKCSFLLNILYYMGARADAQLLRKACKGKEYNRSLALLCLQCGANPNEARYKRYSGNDVRYSDPHYAHALNLACYHGDLELVKELINAGVDCSKRDYMYYSPLYYAKTDDIMKLLLEHNALDAYVDEKKRYIPTYYVNEEIYRLRGTLDKLKRNMITDKEMEKFIEVSFYFLDGREIHSHDKKITIKLMAALYKALVRCITNDGDRKRLLSCIVQHDKYGVAFEAAIKHDDVDFVLLIEKKLAQFQSYGGRYLSSFLPIMCKHEATKILTYFYDKHEQFKLDRTVIWHTAAWHSLQSLKFLLESAKNPLEELQRKNAYDQTVFYVATTRHSWPLQEYGCFTQAHKKQFLEQELHNAVEIEKCDGLSSFIQFCIDNGADLSCVNFDGKSPAEQAQENLQKHVEIFDKEKTNICMDICKAFQGC